MKQLQEHDWHGKGYAFFSNKACEYYPCHKLPEGEDFNCLFCYCPLYALGRGCGGNFTYLEGGIKNCSKCIIPHRRESYGWVTQRYHDIVAAMTALEQLKK